MPGVRGSRADAGSIVRRAVLETPPQTVDGVEPDFRQESPQQLLDVSQPWPDVGGDLLAEELDACQHAAL